MKSFYFSARMHRSVQIFALLGMLLSLSGNAWGVDYKASVAVINGKGGEAKVKVYVNSTYNDEKSTASSTLIQASAWSLTNQNTTYTYTATANTGYNFVGWYSDANANTLKSSSNPYEFSNKGAATYAYYAKFSPINYTISYDLADGNATNPTSYTIESATFTLNQPTREGYTFLGWTGSNGETPQKAITIEQGNTGNKSYTANWSSKRPTTIVWNQTFINLTTSSDDIVLAAHAENESGENLGAVTFSISSASYAEIQNSTTLHVKGEGTGAQIIAYYAGTDEYAPATEFRDIIVTGYPMPVWVNDWTNSPAVDAEFYLYNTTNGKFVKEGFDENKSEAFVDAANATLWKYTSDKKIESKSNSNNFIANRTSQASTNGTGNAKDYTISYDNGKFKITSGIYCVYNNGGKFSGKIGSNSEWYLVSQAQMTYHAAAVTAINTYLIDESKTYSAVIGNVRDALYAATHATSDWTNASATLATVIAAFVAEYNAIAHHDLSSCDGYQMLYTGENKVKILDQTAVAKIATWNGDHLVLTTIEGTPQVIPAHTSVLIYDSEDNDCVYTFTQDDAATITENAFEYHNSSEMGEHTDYILSKNKETGVVAFRKYTGTDTTADRHSVLVWRPTSGQAQAPAVINIETEEMTPTALVPVYDETERPTDGRIFTIMGIEVSDMSHPGIYIQNGKKFIVY